MRDGITLLHLCYEVLALDESLKWWASAGFRRISLAHPPSGIVGSWVYRRQYSLIELPKDTRGRGRYPR